MLWFCVFGIFYFIINIVANLIDIKLYCDNKKLEDKKNESKEK